VPQVVAEAEEDTEVAAEAAEEGANEATQTVAEGMAK